MTGSLVVPVIHDLPEGLEERVVMLQAPVLPDALTYATAAKAAVLLCVEALSKDFTNRGGNG